MTNARPKAGKRVQIYMDARHVDWWKELPRWQRSSIVAQALDLYREARKQARTDEAQDATKPHQTDGERATG